MIPEPGLAAPIPCVMRVLPCVSCGTPCGVKPVPCAIGALFWKPGSLAAGKGVPAGPDMLQGNFRRVGLVFSGHWVFGSKSAVLLTYCRKVTIKVKSTNIER